MFSQTLQSKHGPANIDRRLADGGTMVEPRLKKNPAYPELFFFNFVFSISCNLQINR